MAATATTATAPAEITPYAAAKELWSRRQARRNLLPFAQRVVPGYQVGPHHKVLAGALERVEAGDLKRLMVFMPPQHGKSTLCSQVFPCWALGRQPQRQVVQTGYSHEISTLHSRLARNLFVTPEFRSTFPLAVHRPERAAQKSIPIQKQTAHEWGAVAGGSYYAVGVGGGLTGRGMDIGIIDDPHKNREEAESETTRTKVIEWYKSTFYTRLRPDGAIILILTRWHPEDLAGVLLAEMADGGEQWEVISLAPDLAAGKAVWPERYDIEALQRIKLAIGEHEWAALYMQQPTRRGGNMFQVDGIQYHADPGEMSIASYVRFWDLASTTKQRAKSDPDYTVGALVAVEPRDGLLHLWVKDIVAGQWEAPERDRIIRETARRDGSEVRIGIEAVAGYKDTATTMQALLYGQRVVEGIPVSKDKVVRAAPLEPLFEAGHVHLLRAPWNDLFYNEFAGFPKGAKHDDVIDAVSGAYHMLISEPERREIEVFNTVAAFGGGLPDVGW